MAGGGQEDADAFGVARWRIVTLFLLILFVDAMVEIVDGVVLHYLRRNPESAHAWAQLKFEVMALGVVSLLLVVFEACFPSALRSATHPLEVLLTLSLLSCRNTS